MHIRYSQCTSCGFKFPKSKRKISEELAAMQHQEEEPPAPQRVAEDSPAAAAQEPVLPVPAAPPPAAVSEEVVVPIAAPAPQWPGYMAVRDFRAPVNGVLMEFERGLVIKPEIGKRLLDMLLPVVGVDLDTLIVCPHCRKAFTNPPAAKRAA